MSDEREHSEAGEGAFGEAERNDLLIGYLEGELDPAEAELVEERLEADPSARTTLESFETTRALLAGLDTPAPSAEAKDRAYQAVLAAMAASAPAETCASGDVSTPPAPGAIAPASSERQRVAPQGRLIVWTRWIAAAACLAVAGLLVLDSGKPQGQVAKVESGAPRVAPAKVAPKAAPREATPPTPGTAADPAQPQARPQNALEKEAVPQTKSPAAKAPPTEAPEAATRGERADLFAAGATPPASSGPPLGGPGGATTKDALDSTKAELETLHKRDGAGARNRKELSADGRPARKSKAKAGESGAGQQGAPADMEGGRRPAAPRKPDAPPAPWKGADRDAPRGASGGQADLAEAEKSLQEDLAKLSKVLEERALESKRETATSTRPGEAPTRFGRARRGRPAPRKMGGEADPEFEPADGLADWRGNTDDKTADAAKRKLDAANLAGPRAKLSSEPKPSVDSLTVAEAWVVGEDENARLYVLRGDRLSVASARTLRFSQALRAERLQLDTLPETLGGKGRQPAADDKPPAPGSGSTADDDESRSHAPGFAGHTRAPSVRPLKLATSEVAHVSSRVALKGSAREDVVAILGREMRTLSISSAALKRLSNADAPPIRGVKPGQIPSPGAPGAPGAQNAEQEEAAKKNAVKEAQAATAAQAAREAQAKAHAAAEVRVRKLLRLLGHEANDPRQFPKLHQQERARVRAGR